MAYDNPKYIHSALTNLGVQSFSVEPETGDYQVFGVNDTVPTEEEFRAAYDAAVAGEGLRRLRKRRDAKLAQTDWWALSDRTMTAEQIAYRQALRDITNTYSSLDDVVWPTKPE